MAEGRAQRISLQSLCTCVARHAWRGNNLGESKFNALVTNYNDDKQEMQYGKEGMLDEVMPHVSS